MTRNHRIILFCPKLNLAATLLAKDLLVGVIIEENRGNNELTEFLTEKNVPYKLINKDSLNSPDLRSFLSSLNPTLGLSYSFGLIFPSCIFNLFPKGIINIHPGSFEKFRGRHAIQWAILENEDTITVTCHAVSSKIDSGAIAHTFRIPRVKSDNVATIELKIENALISHELTKVLRNINLNIFTTSICGPYRPRFPQNHIYETLDHLDFQTLFNLLKTQETYSGIRYQGKQYFSCRIATASEIENSSKSTLVTIKNGVCVVLE